MEKDLNKLKEIEPHVEDFTNKLAVTVRSLILNFMELKTILIEKNVLDSKFETMGNEYWSELEKEFGDEAFDNINSIGENVGKAHSEFNLRFTSIISHVFHQEYFDTLNTFGSYLINMQEEMSNILVNVWYLLSKNIIPHKDYSEDFRLLFDKRISLSQSIDAISKYHLADTPPDDKPGSKLYQDIEYFEGSLESKLKRIGKACLQLKKENPEKSENLQYWIEISGVKEGNSKRRNPRRKEEYVGLVMKDAISHALKANKSLSPKELSEEIFTEEALMQEGNKIDKNIAAVLSREKGKIFKSLGNGKWKNS